MSGRAHRVATAVKVPADDGLAPEYASSFEVVGADVERRSPEQWARSTFEGAPVVWRWFLIFGWRAVLRLRLGPRASPDHVLGWTIAATSPTTLTLRARSTLVTADKVLDVRDGRLTVTTLVRYQSWLGRVVWSAIAPIHHVVEPLLITRAASRLKQSAG